MSDKTKGRPESETVSPDSQADGWKDPADLLDDVQKINDSGALDALTKLLDGMGTKAFGAGVQSANVGKPEAVSPDSQADGWKDPAGTPALAFRTVAPRAETIEASPDSQADGWKEPEKAKPPRIK